MALTQTSRTSARLMALVDARQYRVATVAQLILAAVAIGAVFFRTLPAPAFSLVQILVLGQVVTVYLLVGQAIRERCPATAMLGGAFLSTLIGFNVVPAVLGLAGHDPRTVYPLAASAAQSLFAGWFVVFALVEGYCKTLHLSMRQFLVRAGGILVVAALAPIAATFILAAASANIVLDSHYLLGISFLLTLSAFVFFTVRTTHTMTNVALRASLQCSLLDVALVAISPSHSFGSFEAQSFGLIACVIVPAVFLVEFNGMYTRLAQEAQVFQRQALHDPLTGVGNRRAYEAMIEMRLGDLARDHVKQVALLVVDIDDFKRFNDSNGHAAGDRCLVKIATAIELAASRAGDSVFRIGGEEFVAVLAFSQGDGPLTVAERVRRAVWDLNIAHLSTATGRVTVSVGVAVAPEHGTTEGALFAQADAALYQAKAQGKNCVVVRRDANVTRPSG